MAPVAVSVAVEAPVEVLVEDLEAVEAEAAVLEPVAAPEAALVVLEAVLEVAVAVVVDLAVVTVAVAVTRPVFDTGIFLCISLNKSVL